MAGGRTLHVRCSTWEQVETFYSRKLRKGKLLSMKVPFAAMPGGSVTLGLELPNEVVVAIDGTVLKASPIDGDAKTWIEVELHGFTDEVVQRIKNMASGRRRRRRRHRWHPLRRAHRPHRPSREPRPHRRATIYPPTSGSCSNT